MCKGAGFPLGPKRRPTPSGRHRAAAAQGCCALVPQDWRRLSPFAERGGRKEGKTAFSKGVKTGWVKASRLDLTVPGVFYRGWSNIYSVLSASSA